MLCAFKPCALDIDKQKWQILTRTFGILPLNHRKHCVSTTTLSVATKLGKVVTYHEGLPLLKSHVLQDHVTKLKHIFTTKLGRVTKLILRELTLWLWVLVRSQGRLKPLYLHFHNGHQIWYDHDFKGCHP